MTLPFALPPPERGQPAPEWDGSAFVWDGGRTRVLRYLPESGSGWSDALTTIHEQEAGGDHAIDLASRAYALDQLARHLPAGAPVVLEVGCSSGFMLRDIQQAFPQAVLLGGDFVSGPLEALGAVLPTVPLLQFDMRSCPLPDRTVDAVVMLNVLEHIDRDADALREAWRILKPGGIAVIEVPAGPDLFDDYDRQLMHHRRYDMQTLAGRAREAGFEILRRSHLGFLVYPAFWAVKKKNRRFGTRTAEAGQRRVRSQIRYTRKLSLLGVAMQVELVLGKCVRFPAGIRCLVTGRKPAQV